MQTRSFFFRWVLREAFFVALFTYALVTLLEDVVPGFLSNVLSPHAVLAVLAVIGCATFLFPQERVAGKSKSLSLWAEIALSSVLGLLASVVVYEKVRNLPGLAQLLPMLVFFSFLALLLFLRYDREDKDETL